MTSRIAWADYAKVICIYLMVSCHVGLKGMLLDLIYQFHMPAFFIISGMFFRPKGVLNVLKSLGVPILFYGVINLLYSLAIGFYHTHFNLLELIQGEGVAITVNWLQSFLFSTGNTGIGVFRGYWFVLSLLLIRMFMEIRYMRERKFLLACLCVVWCCVEPYLSVPREVFSFKPYHVVSAIPFFVTGMIIKEKKWNVMKGSFELKLTGFALFFTLTLIQGWIDLASYRYGYSYAIVFINALLGSWLLFNVCNYMPQRKWITNLGLGTLLILGLHRIIYPFITGFFTHFLNISNPYLPLLVGVIVMAICYPLILLFDKRSPILLGKVK